MTHRLIARPILDNVGITDSAAQVALLAGLNMYGFVVLMFVATCVVERQVAINMHRSPTDMVVDRYGCGVLVCRHSASLYSLPSLKVVS
jgi:hypothetical protein